MKNRYLKVCGICILVAIMVQNCAVTKMEAYPRMYEKPPLSILVLPPTNESTAAEAQEYYQATITEPLTLTGYYAYPIEVVSDILKNEGMYETVDFREFDPAQFKKYFGADAVLFVNILKWDKAYYVIGGHVVVSVDMKLVSTETKETIWYYNGTLKLDTSVDAGNILINAIATAVNTAVTDYVPVAKKANIQALMAIPYGKYHPKHLKDGKMKPVNKVLLEKADK